MLESMKPWEELLDSRPDVPYSALEYERIMARHLRVGCLCPPASLAARGVIPLISGATTLREALAGLFLNEDKLAMLQHYIPWMDELARQKKETQERRLKEWQTS